MTAKDPDDTRAFPVRTLDYSVGILLIARCVAGWISDRRKIISATGLVSSSNLLGTVSLVQALFFSKKT